MSIHKEFIRKDALLSEYFDVFLFEDSPAKSKPVETVYIEEVRKSNIYIGILGQQYGVVGKGKMQKKKQNSVKPRQNANSGHNSG